MIRRDWTAARAKVEAEGDCRAADGSCTGPLEAAHVIGRTHDREVARGKRVVDADSIVPLCRKHHMAYDVPTTDDRLDLLPHLTLDEQVRAVQDAGGIEAARRRITGERLTSSAQVAPSPF